MFFPVPDGAKPASELVAAARRAPFPYHASPSGRWICFEGKRNVVYVVANTWGEGYYVVAVGDGEEAQARRFARPEDAVEAGASLALNATGTPARQPAWQGPDVAS